MAIPTDFRIADRSLVRPAFVETGYHRGAAVAAALAAGFDSVESVEYDRRLYCAGLLKFANEPRVRLHRGSGPDVLPSILDPKTPTTIYLHDHFLGPEYGPPDPVYGECPLLAELDAVGRVPWAVRPIVVVDDWHLFRRPWESGLLARLDPDQWPEAGAVLDRLHGCGFVHTEFTLYAFPD